MFLKFDYSRGPTVIIDTDFEEQFPGTSANGWEDFFAIYERRKLNVAANAAIAFKYWSKGNSFKMNNTIANNRKYNSLYEKYAEEINKYLMLI